MSGPPSSDGTPADTARSAALAALSALGRAVSASDKPDEVVQAVAAMLDDLLHPDRLLAVMRDPERNDDAVAFVRGVAHPQPDDAVVSLLRHHGPLLLSDNVADGLAALGVSAVDLPASLVGAPFPSAAGTLGALWLGANTPGRFVEADREIVTAVASFAAIAIEKARFIGLLSSGKREWEQTVDAIGQAFCVLDTNRTVRRANRAFSELVAVPITHIPGRPLISLLPPTWAEPVGRFLDDLGAVAGLELRAGARVFNLSGFPLTGRSSGTIVLAFDDLTEKRRLQDQLIQAEKMSAIGQLIAGVAHDLNNPLASVIGFADYLVEGSLPAPERMVEPLRAIQQEAQRAANIVRNLLSFARKQEHQHRPIPIRRVLEATLLLLKNQLMASKVDANLEIAPNLPDVTIDPNQVQQVFLNLINNAAQAIQASGTGTEITVRAVPWLDGVAVVVEDDGPGIPPELRERVFEPFFTTKPEGEGTGLGLAICQGIIREHGGHITLSERLGGGAVFRIELPGGVDVEERPVRDPDAPGCLRILVVDDEPHIRHYMRATLEAWGHTVTIATDGNDGLARAASEDYDIIITDLRMPGLGGRELFEALARDHPRAASRVVFATGDTVREGTQAFLESTRRPCLRKPFTLNELRTVLARAATHADR